MLAGVHQRRARAALVTTPSFVKMGGRLHPLMLNLLLCKGSIPRKRNLPRSYSPILASVFFLCGGGGGMKFFAHYPDSTLMTMKKGEALSAF